MSTYALLQTVIYICMDPLVGAFFHPRSEKYGALRAKPLY